MKELNFCPYCDVPQHKVISLDNKDTYFCRGCNTFFTLKEEKYVCFKCGSTRIEDSEFPSPDGRIVFQCRKCKKMYSGTELFDKCEKDPSQ